MKKHLVLLAGAAVLVALPMMVSAASCPQELTDAKTALKSAQAAMKKGAQTSAKSQDLQAPRSMAGARPQDVQAPRGQDVQAPRGQDVQAPRGQDVQAPRGQDVQAPRGQDVQSPRGQDVQAPRGRDVQAPRTPAGATATDTTAQKVKQAGALIRESEAACKKGDMALSTSKATEAQALLK